MKSCSHRTITLVIAVALAAAVAPLAGAARIDGRSPDTKDTAQAAAASGSWTTSDLRSPDTRSAALRTSLAAPVADARSPDTQAAAALAGTRAPAAPAPTAGDGFEWADAGIGVGAGLAIALLLATAFLVARRGHGGGRVASST